jgi:beta-lactamase superfamily II metal-dependent hydrolase
VEEGLGNACLIQFPDDSCGFVDWGTQKTEPLERAIELIGRSRIRFIAASHAHSDHTLGIAQLLRECHRRKLRIEKFVYPASTLNKQTADLTAARIAAHECNIGMYAVGEDSFTAPPGLRRPPWLAFDEKLSWEIRILSPSILHVADAEVDSLLRQKVAGNETSFVFVFRFIGASAERGMGRFLLPGDSTPATLRYAQKTAEKFSELALDNQLFLVPHHGSKYNCPTWIDQYIHGAVIFSTPTDSRHHPSAKILKRLSKMKSNQCETIFCTSYAHTCYQSFGSKAPLQDNAIVQPGPCFGDIRMIVPQRLPAYRAASSHNGSLRRPYGHCSNAPKDG